ncbi:hypothetical protein MNB_SV-15-1523 [hydrothermal vent metagenome]|uniref:DUF86 domain-containing protein n=1 Tax=hydrothermal vent metagenome TaxID=652676 RepID=A0A1W1EJM4_9ZZZZ
MGNKTLIYKIKVEDNLKQSYTHLKRLNNAFTQLQNRYIFPIDKNSYIKIIDNIQDLAFSDQIIYRFSKLQDTIGAKLFKGLLLYQGENIDKPFLDILNQLEKIDIVNVDEWFELRDLRNEIAHDYDNSDYLAIDILNNIFELKKELEKILNSVKNLIG